MTNDNPIHDRPASPTVLCETRVHDGFRKLDIFQIRLPHEGPDVTPLSREMLRVGRVVGLLPYDPVLDRVVLLRQFRLSAHIGSGRGEMIEIVAGGVEGDETVEDAARREANEEIGLMPSALHLLYRFFPAPGMMDEDFYLFLGIVDSTQAAAAGGLAHEREHILPFTTSRTEAIAALDAGGVANGPTLLALLWLARQGEAVRELARNLPA